MGKKDKHSSSLEIDAADILEEAASVVKTRDISPDDGSVELDDSEQAKDDSDSSSENIEEEKKEVDYKDRFIRLSADFDNYRKRILKEKTDYIKYGNEALLKELLPILDNFERALGSSSESDAASILQGVEMIFGQFTQTLEKFGLKGETTKGHPFDPNLHEAMSNQESEDHEPNTIMEEHQKLYRYHEKLLRPALVTVSKAKDEPQA